MHGKGLNILIFVLVMGPLIWISQRLHLGDTGTFVCVVVGLVLGFFILIGGKGASRKLRRTFTGAKNDAVADFLLGPSDPRSRQLEMSQMHRQVSGRAGAWNAPSLQGYQTTQPLMPHPAKRPGSLYDPDSPQYAPSYQQQPPVTRVIPVPPAQVPGYALPAQQAPRPPQPRAAQPNNGPRLELGPGAQMLLSASLTGMLVVDAQVRRPVAPVFLEEWVKLGLGLLIIDTHGQYTGYLAHMPSGFGFLAGGKVGQERLTTTQQGQYMEITATRDATHVGQSIIDEGLQVIWNFASYSNTTEAGTMLLAMLAGIERKAREFTTGKPCAILFTDAQPFTPANEADCGIENSSVAQSVYDMLMTLVEHAGQPALKNLGVCLAVPSVEGVEEETLVTSRLWVINCTGEAEIEDICQYLELTDEEVDQLMDGDTLLFDTMSDVPATFVRFRRPGIVFASKPIRSAPHQAAERQTEKLPEEEQVGGESGLRTEDQK